MEIKDLRSAFFFQNQLLEATGSVRANTFTSIARRNSAVTRAIIFRRATSWWRSWSGCRKPCTASGSRRPSPIPTRTIRSCRCGRKLRLMSQQWLILAPWKPLPTLPSFPIESNRLKRMELNRPCRQWRRPQKKHLPKSKVRVQYCLPVDGGFVSMTMSCTFEGNCIVRSPVVSLTLQIRTRLQTATRRLETVPYCKQWSRLSCKW